MTNIVDIFTDASNGFDILLAMFNLANELSFNMFSYVLVVLPFIAMYVLSKKIITLAILYTVIGAPVMIIAPWELKGPAMLMFIFGVSGITYKWFVDR